AEDRILECYIRNLPAPPSPLIELYLREVDFSHVALLVYYHSRGRVVIVEVVGGWDLLGLVPEMIYGGQIKMSWLRRNFEGLDEDLTEVKKERHVRTYIFQITRAILMPDKSQNLIHLKWLLKLVNFREADELS
ncbi:hypothetical protein Golax_010142, partial [Gossypium laxum]|nr:hypothetical protein [Gossypium laxum]